MIEYIRFCGDHSTWEGTGEKSLEKELIRCKDCKHQIVEFRKDGRMKAGGYTVKACRIFADIIGYFGWGGEDEQFCSEAEPKLSGNTDTIVAADKESME
jgi:hypothetical protein